MPQGRSLISHALDLGGVPRFFENCWTPEGNCRCTTCGAIGTGMDFMRTHTCQAAAPRPPVDPNFLRNSDE